MSKYIAHLSIDERGKVSGGKAGDQTGKEACIRTWYSKPWKYILRIKDEKIRKQFANNMIDLVKNDNIGYDQLQRNTLLTQAIKVNFDFSKIKNKCEGDCSSGIVSAILGAIYKVYGKSEYEKAKKILYSGNNCRTTSTLRSGLNALKMINTYDSKDYVNGTSKLVYGDILVKEGSHVVCYVNDAKKVSIDNKTNIVNSSVDKTTSYYKKYTGKSQRIDEVLRSIGVPSKYYGTWKKRKDIAKKNGIKDYIGTAKQNTTLISLAKQGKLKKV